MGYRSDGKLDKNSEEVGSKRETPQELSMMLDILDEQATIIGSLNVQDLLRQATQRAQAEALLRRGNGGDDSGSDMKGGWNSGSGGLEGFGPDAAQQSLARSRMSLLDSRRVVEETEVIGQGVIGDLESQGESLLRSQANMRETGSIATRARRVLRTMARRDFRHRLCLYFVILCLSVAIFLVLYIKLQKYFGGGN